MTKISFYKRDGNWYADLPDYLEAGGTEDDCEMIAGAGEWLDVLSNNGTNVTLELSGQPLQNRIDKIHEDDFGATYIAHEYNESVVNQQLWLCPVTLFVLGEYPSKIYYNVH